jgi:hypothetical protein
MSTEFSCLVTFNLMSTHSLLSNLQPAVYTVLLLSNLQPAVYTVLLPIVISKPCNNSFILTGNLPSCKNQGPLIRCKRELKEGSLIRN